MAADDDAGVVAPEEEEALVLEVVVAVQPVLQGQVREDVARLRYPHLSDTARMDTVFTDSMPDLLHSVNFKLVSQRCNRTKYVMSTHLEKQSTGALLT